MIPWASPDLVVGLTEFAGVHPTPTSPFTLGKSPILEDIDTGRGPN